MPGTTSRGASALTTTPMLGQPFPSGIHSGVVTRTLLIVLLVLLILLLAIPLGMGMAMGMCPNSHTSTCPSAVGACAAIIGLMVLVTIGHLGIIRRHESAAPLLLIVTSLERPPQRSSF